MFCIMKNISCSNKGNVHLFTITLFIIVPMLSILLQLFFKKVFNFHVKFDGAIICKVSLILFFFIVLQF
jgi:hypothetical protein